MFFKINLNSLTGTCADVLLDQLPGNPMSQAFHASCSEQDENSKSGGTA
jgi:hypothetical protein